MKQIRGDLYILSSGYHILQAISCIGLKVPLLQFSSEKVNGEDLMNGPVSYLAPDHLPIIGLSGKYDNLLYNFGMTNTALISCQTAQERLAYQQTQANLVAAQAMHWLGLGPSVPTASHLCAKRLGL